MSETFWFFHLSNINLKELFCCWHFLKHCVFKNVAEFLTTHLKAIDPVKNIPQYKMKSVKYFIFLIGQSLQCTQCGKMENNFQCKDADTGVSTECLNETTYCQNITTNRFTFKSCGIMDFGHEIDGQDECIFDFVSNFRLKIINYIHLYWKKKLFARHPMTLKISKK